MNYQGISRRGELDQHTEPSSYRANFSPFTKDYRELGLTCDLSNF